MELKPTQGLAVPPISKLVLTPAHCELMRAHVERCLPFEACGLLAGKLGTVQEVIVITNKLRSSTRFRMEPAEQVRAFAAIESRGLELLGIFHSHPADPGTADAVRVGLSATDIAEAAYPVVHVLWSRARGQWAAKGYWIVGEQVSEVVLDIMELG